MKKKTLEEIWPRVGADGPDGVNNVRDALLNFCLWLQARGYLRGREKDAEVFTDEECGYALKDFESWSRQHHCNDFDGRGETTFSDRGIDEDLFQEHRVVRPVPDERTPDPRRRSPEHRDAEALLLARILYEIVTLGEEAKPWADLPKADRLRFVSAAGTAIGGSAENAPRHAYRTFTAGKPSALPWADLTDSAVRNWASAAGTVRAAAHLLRE